MFIAAVVLMGAGTAVAANTIGSGDIINNSIKSEDVKNNSLKSKDVRDETLQTADLSQAARDELAGQDGEDGVATYSNPEWGIISRNHIGSALAVLRGGPFVQGANGSPPFGQGSLALAVSDQAQNPAAPGASGQVAEKASFGNEVDFAGDNVGDLDQLGFHVFQTGENNTRGNPNMPSISIEIDPNMTATASNFSTLVFVPSNSPSNQWSGYIDAAADGADFFLSGAAGTATGCNQATYCDLDEVQTALAEGGNPDATPALIGSIAVTKGRDHSWVGAVDGLRVNDTIYDFEPFGVQETDATP